VTHSIVIIGAGVAGLSAARALADRGLQPIVLEGRERIGGRIWTVRLDRNAIDLGASWIHGTRGNPIAKLAREAHVSLKKTDWDQIRFPGVKVGKARKAMALTRRLFQCRGLGSVADAIPKIWLGDPLTRWALTTMIAGEYGEDPAALSLKHWRDDSDFGGGDFLVTCGYGELVTHLAKGSDIRTGHTAQAVRQNREGISVETDRGTFYAEHVIVTLPLGVLKAGSVRFDPQLPTRKQHAIKRLGVGVLNKLVLVFEHRFWPKGTRVIGRQGPYSIFVVQGRTLVGLVGGSAARMPVPEATEDVLHSLGAPQPIACIATQWHDDPFSLGATSVVGPSGTSADFDVLRAKAGRLFFAGEATSRAHRGTVHGAYLSGQQAANELLTSCSLYREGSVQARAFSDQKASYPPSAN
jgi:monoamine oxidase